MLRFACPFCHFQISVEESDAGGRIVCPACAKTVAIPATRFDNGCIIGYDSGRLDIDCGGAEISFAPASSGADDGSITVFYGRHKDKTLPEGKNTIDLQTGGNDLEFTPAGDGFRIRRL